MRDSNSISSGLDVYYWPPRCENNQGMITKEKNSTAPVISSVRESGLIGLTPKPCCFSAYSVVMKIVSQNTLFAYLSRRDHRGVDEETQGEEPPKKLKEG